MVYVLWDLVVFIELQRTKYVFIWRGKCLSSAVRLYATFKYATVNTQALYK